jgi:UDP-galactopyranose mutase
MWESFDILVVGAGLSGATLAERYASLGKKVLVLEKRDHIGGNCYDEVNEWGIRVSRYGAHIFHTNDEEVHGYIHRFSEWVPYEHRVLAKVGRLFVPLPVNLKTVNMLTGLHLHTAAEMNAWLSSQQVQLSRPPQTSEEMGLSRFGKLLYHKLFLPYTQKQWNKHPRELDASVIGRIPLRTSGDDRYFTDTYQYLPKHGYTPFFEKLLSNPNIHVMTNTDYFELKPQIEQQQKRFEKIFYTGPIDQFFEFQRQLGSTLEYRSLEFISEWHSVRSPKDFWQPSTVVNYPSLRTPYTRSVEYKQFTRNVDEQSAMHTKTVVVKEKSVDYGEPFYPVPSAKNQQLYEQYKRAADQLAGQGIYFVGRLANYKYFNMDEAIKNALQLFHQLEAK